MSCVLFFRIGGSAQLHVFGSIESSVCHGAARIVFAPPRSRSLTADAAWGPEDLMRGSSLNVQIPSRPLPQPAAAL